ncbi:hypothetical protein V6Z11_A09G030700 [Gossypium hirsutum]
MVADGTSMTPGMEELVGVCDAWEWYCRGVGWQTSWGGQGSFFLCYFFYWSGLGLVVWAVLYWVLRGLSNWVVFGPKLACNMDDPKSLCGEIPE